MGSYVPSTQAQREQMLRAVGLENVMDLYRDVPEQMLLRKPLNIPDGMSELEAARAVSAMAAENRTYATILRGAGAYDHYIPSIVKYIPAKEEFLTAYTPYQAEMSQGLLQSIFEYQTMICELTGMDVAREIRKTDSDVRIAFGTTSNEFASESYEVNACYYLHKPFDRERVKAMLDRIDLAQVEKERTIQLPDGKSVVLRDIIYADYAAHYTTLHCKYGKDIILRATLSEIEALLCGYPYFFIPSKGLIINFHEVDAQNADTFTMSNGSLIPISRRQAKEVTDAYSSFLFEQLRKGGKR